MVLNVFHSRPNISLCPQGYLDRSPVFFGFYTPSTQKSGCVSTPLLYLAGIFSILLFSLILEVRRSGPQSVLREEMLPFKVKPLTFRSSFNRTTVGYKHTWMLGKRYSVNVTYKIFCGWDFAIQDPGSATLKQGFIRNDLKVKGLCQGLFIYLFIHLTGTMNSYIATSLQMI